MKQNRAIIRVEIAFTKELLENWPVLYRAEIAEDICGIRYVYRVRN